MGLKSRLHPVGRKARRAGTGRVRVAVPVGTVRLVGLGARHDAVRDRARLHPVKRNKT